MHNLIRTHTLARSHGTARHSTAESSLISAEKETVFLIAMQ